MITAFNGLSTITICFNEDLTLMNLAGCLECEIGNRAADASHQHINRRHQQVWFDVDWLMTTIQATSNRPTYLDESIH